MSFLTWLTNVQFYISKVRFRLSTDQSVNLVFNFSVFEYQDALINQLFIHWLVYVKNKISFHDVFYLYNH